MSVTLVDPLSEVSRKERRMLLGLSMLSLFFTHGGALPTKFTALGVELGTGEQRTFLFIIAVGLLYFLSAFFLYSMSDFIVWRKKMTEEYIKESRGMIQSYMYDNSPQNQYDAEVQFEEEKAWRKYQIWSRLTKPMSLLRAIFEFMLPIIVAIYSIANVLTHAYSET
ncbi:hypothetical protein [Rheinheimera pleomorphica]|uniref:hypothetical protein n=1 Tax=Rheinheimera pleomorphica TaxID=2703963 RepID=UPI00141E98F5|nr:hypothetical protein [Rheinheimera pleomorphica]